MTGMRDRDDRDAVIRDLLERVRILETANPLGNASITSGPGLRVGTPEGLGVDSDDGIVVRDGGSIKVGTGPASGRIRPSGGKIGMDGDVDVSGNVKAASGTYIGHVQGGSVGAGGTTIDADGKIGNSGGVVNFKTNVTGVANATFEGVARGRLGVEAPLEPGGGLVSLGPAVKEADRKGQSGYDNAVAARGEAAAAKSRADTGVTKADAADAKAQSAWNLADSARDIATGRATVASVQSAHGRANDAYSLASGKASQGDLIALQTAVGHISTKVDWLWQRFGPGS